MEQIGTGLSSKHGNWDCDMQVKYDANLVFVQSVYRATRFEYRSRRALA
jgi:hypothetical protein